MPSALRRGEIVRIRDERWSVARHQEQAGIAILDVCGCDHTNRGVRARFLLPFERLDRLPAPAAVRAVSRRRWRHLARHVLSTALPRCDSLRALAGARVDILPFQLEPALAVVRGLATRLLIADDVGLGKTVEAGLIVAETLERDGEARALVICPAALRAQWCAELATRFGLEAELFDSSSLARLTSDLAPGINPWTAQRLIVTSVDYLKRPEVLRALETVIWDLVIVDEAHGLASRSDRHAAAIVLGSRARTFVMLTATPHSGDADAFARLCGIGDIDERFPLGLFRRTRHDVGLAAGRRTVWRPVRLHTAEMAMHEALLRYARRVWQDRHAPAGAHLAMTVLMRRACSSAAALGRSIERRLALLGVAADPAAQPGLPFDGDNDDDEEPGAALAIRGLADAYDERRHLEQVLSLARAASGCERKLRALRTLLRRTAEPAIVFTDYRDTLTMLAAELHAFGCDVLHGGLTDDERHRVLQRFTSGLSRVLLATDAAGEGLNLHGRCRLVVNLEVPWTPVRLEQRIGRVDRIGQRRRVHQVLLVAAGTAEQTVVAEQMRARSRRIRSIFAVMRPPHADEQEIAERILGSPPAPSTAAACEVALPRGVMVPDLRSGAAAEATRAVTARALAVLSPAVSAPLRPFGTTVAREPKRGCWAFRVSIGPSAEEIVWETILAASYEARGRRVSTARDVAACLALARAVAQRLVADRQHDLLAGSVVTLHAATALALARERAIAAELERRQARLAATLIQRGLFDRRVERDAAARREVLQGAIVACRDHLARLEDRAKAGVVSIEPAFAVLLP